MANTITADEIREHLLPAIMYVTGYCTGMKGTSMRH